MNGNSCDGYAESKVKMRVFIGEKLAEAKKCVAFEF